MTVHFSPEAEADFASVVGYLARGEFDGPAALLNTGEVVRSWPVPPVRVYYQRHAEALWIIRIYHQAQPPLTR